MSAETDLKAKLRKIEALFAGAATAGEKTAAGAAADRIRARLREIGKRESPVEVRFSLHDPWARRLFIALCRRYGLKPYRYPRMKQQSVVVSAPATFIDDILWPEFSDINEALEAYLSEVTDKVIREEVHQETGEADVIQEPRGVG